MTVGGVPLPDAIRLRELLFHITGPRRREPAQPGARPAPSPSPGCSTGTGGIGAAVGVDWDLLAGQARPRSRPTPTSTALFPNFNPVPNLFGTAHQCDRRRQRPPGVSGAASAPTPSACSCDNMTDGSSCEVAALTDPDRADLHRRRSPAATRNAWDNGDLYRLDVGSPLAMLEAAARQPRPDHRHDRQHHRRSALGERARHRAADRRRISPRQLLGQIQELRQTIERDPRQPAAHVACGTLNTGGTVTGDPSEVVYDADGDGDDLLQRTSTSRRARRRGARASSPRPGVTVHRRPAGRPGDTVGGRRRARRRARSRVQPGRRSSSASCGARRRRHRRFGYQVDGDLHATSTGITTQEYPTLAQPSTHPGARAGDQGEARHRRRLQPRPRSTCRRRRRQDGDGSTSTSAGATTHSLCAPARSTPIR